jgi:catechol 2,3-dioxygenase-like lactoylglutathione lyase family enzyme
MVPVADQDEAIAFYTTKLGFSVAADVPFGESDRWVEVAPPGGGAAVALVPPQSDFPTNRMTGIALESADPAADHAELRARGVDVDSELMGGEGGVRCCSFPGQQPEHPHGRSEAITLEPLPVGGFEVAPAADQAVPGLTGQ